MALRLSHTSVDARDAYAQARWWAEVLGWSEDPEDPNLPGHDECMIFSPDGRRPDGSGWVTLADPEGNELCVLTSDLDRPDPYAHLLR